jgi:F0F1-type ATP synthase membrane subunit b/b'
MAYDSQGDVPGAGHNFKELAKAFVARIEERLGELDRHKTGYKAAVKEIREDIKLIIDDAKAAGIPKRELKAVVRTRELERRVAAVRDELETVERETYDQIRMALGDFGDTPLGQAALDRVA